ncbi:hypothetical protein LWI29_035852 [Acer saccharum]|uniref:Uncharacterized protein n=1 Tax=Acer saccharum TaxID=4024 RepID=A0AA39SG09_ACESA|nr:hypothetical protein LWI29_035852 [Acer saccharum]
MEALLQLMTVVQEDATWRGCCGGDEALVDCVWRQWEGVTTMVWRIFSDWRILDADLFRLDPIGADLLTEQLRWSCPVEYRIVSAAELEK